ncbi:MAG TPA: thioredoxin domain-containing protein [Thermoanaerobaculia bacterium]|jgi:protein-disulfide isomerase|nr:thioredoxin domain-containing protein [Thermoanaerobaculia bacterium]
MKRLALPLLVLCLASAAFADEPEKTNEKPAPPLGARADKLIKEALPICSEGATESRVAMQHALPPNMVGAVVRIASKHPSCEGQWVAITSTEGGFFFGTPWFLDGQEGTLEEKLKNFTMQYLKEAFVPVIDKTKTRDGLYRTTLYQTVEGGKIPLEGEVDPAGTVFFVGHFVPIVTDYRASRVKALEHFLNVSPFTGAAKPDVTVIEFSDFECPSCQHAAGYMKPILEAHGDKVRYIRYDTPLMTIHPWALAAAVAGRAVWHQKPELFWKYKEQIYANQDKLSAFTIDEFTRGFASDHDLDMKKYDADVQSPELRAELVNGAGTAFTNDVRATPTYIINGTFVDPGVEGKGLAEFVNAALKK